MPPSTRATENVSVFALLRENVLSINAIRYQYNDSFILTHSIHTKHKNIVSRLFNNIRAFDLDATRVHMLDRDNFIKALFPELSRSYRFRSWTSCDAAVQGWSVAIAVFRLIVVYKKKKLAMGGLVCS